MTIVEKGIRSRGNKFLLHSFERCAILGISTIERINAMSSLLINSLRRRQERRKLL